MKGISHTLNWKLYCSVLYYSLFYLYLAKLAANVLLSKSLHEKWTKSFVMMDKHLLYHTQSPRTRLVGSFHAFSIFLPMTKNIF